MLTQNSDAEREESGNGNWILGLKLGVLVLAVLVFFQSDLAFVARDALHDESMSFVFAVPFLFGFLLYRKRKMLWAVMPLESRMQPKIFKSLTSLAGLLLASATMLAYWSSSNVALHMLTLPVFAAALTLILFNVQTLRQAAFPLGFLVFLTPPSALINAVGPTFSSASAGASYAFARFLGVNSVLTNLSGSPVIMVTRVGGEVLSFTVGASGSGLYSLMGFLVFAVFVAFTVRDRLWKRLIVFPVGFLVIYVLAVARIAAVLAIGYDLGKDVAMSFFLLAGGWILTFLGTFAVLVFSDKVLHMQFFSKLAQTCPACGKESNVDQNECFSCGRILKVNPALFHRGDMVKALAVLAAAVLLADPIAKWWGAAVFLGQYGASLAVAVCVFLPALAVVYIIEFRETRREDAEFFGKLSSGTREIIDAVGETGGKTTPTLNAITEVYESKTGESIAYQEMLRKLDRAEGTGIVEPQVESVQDEPTQVWKSHLKASEEKQQQP